MGKVVAVKGFKAGTDWAILLGSFLEAEQIQHRTSFSLLPLSMHMCCLKGTACIWELERKLWSTGGSSQELESSAPVNYYLFVLSGKGPR